MHRNGRYIVPRVATEDTGRTSLGKRKVETETGKWYNVAYVDGAGASAERKMLRKARILSEDNWSVSFQLATGSTVRISKLMISYISEWTGDDYREGRR